MNVCNSGEDRSPKVDKLIFPSELHIGISVCVKQTYVKANDVLRMSFEQ
jgi:hypothetical protein